MEEINTFQKLFEQYKNGQISECQYNGNLVYSASLNAYDAGSTIYDQTGNQIGNCNYAWGTPDQMCNEFTNCETVYRIEDNIWGQPAVDKYQLGN